MYFLFVGLNGILLVVNVVALVITAVAFIDVLLRRPAAFVAADKQTKVFWILLLVLGLFVTILGVIAAIIYFVDARPAVIAAGGSGATGGGRSSSDGPYGPSKR
jgi:Protein of unknown function (DUF2516)